MKETISSRKADSLAYFSRSWLKGMTGKDLIKYSTAKYPATSFTSLE